MCLIWENGEHALNCATGAFNDFSIVRNCTIPFAVEIEKNTHFGSIETFVTTSSHWYRFCTLFESFKYKLLTKKSLKNLKKNIA